ncbi:AI-2E family transporter [Senegalimassilia anaerobia]
MNRHTIRYAPILVAALAVAALAVARFDGLCSIFSTVWSAFEPLAIGAVLAYLLNFIAAALESRWFPHTNNTLAIKTRRPICVILAITAVTLALAALTSFVGGEFKSAGAAIITGISEAAAMASQAIAYLPGAQAIPILDNATWNSIGQKTLDAMGGTDQALRIVAQTSGEVAHLALSILLGMVFALYLLLDKDRVHAGAMRAASFIPGEDLRRRVLHACSITNDCFSRFIRGQCIEAVILGALCAIGGTILQFPYAASIGLIVGVSSLIPFAGAWIGGIMGAAMILSQDPVQALQFIVFLVILQQIEGHLIYPNVVGQSVGLPSIWVFVAVIAGGSLFGLLGVLLGVPVISTLRTLAMEHFAQQDAENALGPEDGAVSQQTHSA